MSDASTSEETQQTKPIEALTDAVDKHHDGEQCGAPLGSVVEEMLTDPTLDVGDVGHALREGYFHGVIYQPSESTVARVATDGGTETSDTSTSDTERVRAVIEFNPDERSKESILADLRDAFHDEPVAVRSLRTGGER